LKYALSVYADFFSFRKEIFLFFYMHELPQICSAISFSALYGLCFFGCPLSDVPPVVITPESLPEQTEEQGALQDIPLTDAQKRITKKPFGIFITPEDSPVQPERFFGYHSGTDYEVFDGETGELIPVFSVCEGNIRFVGTINGYGGVIIQECMLDDSPVQVLYGHVSLQNAVITVGEKVQEGEQISLLGEHFSAEAGGERKHLHLGIRKGKEIDFRGYVQSESELDNWIDFESWRTTSL
jgi:murein DD-endopeptidase MepM/ murein hydrolase activator NlpD